MCTTVIVIFKHTQCEEINITGYAIILLLHTTRMKTGTQFDDWNMCMSVSLLTPFLFHHIDYYLLLIPLAHVNNYDKQILKFLSENLLIQNFRIPIISPAFISIQLLKAYM